MDGDEILNRDACAAQQRQPRNVRRVSIEAA
jgi:hypothetical protein